VKRKLTLLLLAAGWLAAAPAAAQVMPKPEEVVTLSVRPVAIKGKPGATLSVTLLATIKDGFHVNSNQPNLEYLIPTVVEVQEDSIVTLEKADYPPGELKAFGFAPDEKLSVYEGIVHIPLQLRLKPRAPAGVHDLSLTLRYQPCNDRMCLRPAKRQVALKVLLP